MKTLRNESERAGLIERVKSLSGSEMPSWGKMNVNQMVSHLVQAGEMPFESSVPDRSSFMSRTLLKPLILYVVPVPKEVKTSPEMNQQENGRKPQDFESDKALLIGAINKIGTLPLDHECLAHPFFGAMTAKQWSVLASKHIDHHLTQFGV
ncbi:MAG: DUF1569 domain-containing protein [Pyrinomonadaceae bacterium]